MNNLLSKKIILFARHSRVNFCSIPRDWVKKMRLRISEVETSIQFDSVLQILLQYVVKSISRTSIYNILKIFVISKHFWNDL